MALYIKANKKVTQFLKLENDRNRLKDGNYLLWQADALNFGKLIDLPAILEQIGGIALQAHEARQEQDGKILRPLPEAADPRFKDETPKEADKENETPTSEDVSEVDNKETIKNTEI